MTTGYRGAFAIGAAFALGAALLGIQVLRIHRQVPSTRPEITLECVAA